MMTHGMVQDSQRTKTENNKLQQLQIPFSKNTSNTPAREQHSVAIDTQGVAYSWGCGGSSWDGAGSLGLGDLEETKHIVSSPTEITALSSVGAKVGR